MAIRSTNANRASKAYNPAAKPQGGASAGDRADFGQGPPGRMTKQDQIDRRRQEYGDSPWYGKDGNPMPWSGPDGQQRGQRAPMFTPNAGDPRNAGYFKNQSTPEEIAADNAAAASRYRGQQDLLAGNDAYMAAKNAGDLKGQIAAMMALKQQMQQQRFVDQGGTPETWQNRYRNEDNWQRPGVAPSPGGGRTMPPPSAPPPGGRTMPQAFPPSQNPMMQGNSMFQNYLGAVERPKANGGGASMSQYGGGGGTSARLDPSQFGGSSVNLDQLMGGGRNSMFEGYRGGAGVPQGPGGFGQFNPMQSKSGMGQSPMSGPAMSTGYPMGGGYMGNAMGASYGGGYNPMAGGMDFGGQGYSAAGGIPPQFLQMLMGGGGGFNPSSMLGGGRSMGYNPYAMLGMF